VSVAALAACGASSASTRPQRIVFGIAGGNVVPWSVTIEPTGRVRTTGSPSARHRLSRAKVASLVRLVRHEFASGLRSRQCSGTLPDIGSVYIVFGGRTVRVHGSCEPRFTRLWDTLARAVGVGPG
jgi:hypothetical protein